MTEDEYESYINSDKGFNAIHLKTNKHNFPAIHTFSEEESYNIACDILEDYHSLDVDTFDPTEVTCAWCKKSWAYIELCIEKS